MKVLICVIGLVVVTFVLANKERSHYDLVCDHELKRKMLIEHCGSRRRRRSFTAHDFNNINKRRYHKIDVVANDTSGGILMRNKRGKYEYCCVPTKQPCERIFHC